MKVIAGILITVIIALVVGCATPSEPKPFPPPEGYESWEAYHERSQRQTETPTPTPYEEIETYYETQPLSYEVVESYTDTDSYKERRRIVIGGVVFQDEVVEVFYPIGCVTLQNTDNVGGTFSVQFTFYGLDRHDAAQLCHPDFKFEDYLAAEDPDSYLDKLNWDRLDLEKFMFFADKHDTEENLTLEPGETATAKYSVPEIDMDRMAWEWEYTITEATKTVEKQRTVIKYR